MLVKEIIEHSLSLLELSDILLDKKEELEELREVKMRGHMIRSRVQQLDEGERPTKYFCALENKSYINKTIKKLESNNVTITNQKEILINIREYYKSLFSSQDNDTDLTTINNVLQKLKLKKVPDDFAIHKTGLITINELSNSLSRMQNNKTPGSDGFPAEFFKVFWIKMKYHVLNSINESYERGQLSSTMRQCIISSLPKGDKPRQFLSNWRPVSLLNVTYKLASSSIANRLKDVLGCIISNTQSGFLAGRYIGETTRLVYDIMNTLENTKQPGLLLLIDFQKAFDSVSWKFLYQILENFNFGPSMINWFKLFNCDIYAPVIQYGHLLEPFQIKRGCRQGDPIASYLFLTCAEILFMLINSNTDITGIKIGNHEYKLAQFADDTTIFLDGSTKSLSSTLNILEIFGTISGLKMNSDKTKVIWIGRKKFSKDKLQTKTPLTWGNTNFDLLGIHFDVNLHSMINTNYSKYIMQLNKSLSQWNKRYLTPLGKITVIKTYAISKLIHLYSTLPLPEQHVKQINTTLYQFLWDNKPDKIKRIQITQSFQNGGLKMVNMESFITALRLSWIKRIVTNTHNPPWISVFESTITPIHRLLNLGCNFIKKLSAEIKNPFWKEVLIAWYKLSAKTPIDTIDQFLMEPIWYNPKLCDYPLFVNECYNKGIYRVHDLLKNTGSLYTREQLMAIYRIDNLDYLTYYRISSMLKKAIKSLFPNTPINQLTLAKPIFPPTIRTLTKSKKGIKHIYNLFNSEILPLHTKWDIDLQTNIDMQTWKYANSLPFWIIKDNYLAWFQFKILYRILGVKSLLFKINITDTNLCSLCNGEVESLIHLFCCCTKTLTLWSEVNEWINFNINKTIPLNKVNIILGYQNNDSDKIPINMIILITKSYIFQSAYKKRNLNLYTLQKKFMQPILTN